MTYSARRQDVEDARRLATAVELEGANINARTGLATDYLNHFNEAIMLLEMIPDMPDCAQDFIAWRPMSYVEHFAASHFAARDLAISAYADADATMRADFDALTAAMTSVLLETGKAMRDVRHEASRARLAREAAGWLRPMVGQAGSLINGAQAQHIDSDIDAIMGNAS